MFINLQFNEITSVNITTPKTTAMNNFSLDTTIDLGYNPIQCDCKIIKFWNYLQNKSNDINVKAEDVTCDGPSIYKGMKIKDLNETFQCQLVESIAQPQNFCTICDCWIMPFKNKLTLNCTNSNHQITDLTDINEALEIDLHFQYKNLTKFPDLRNKTYNSKINLLDLSNNFISEINETYLPPNLKVFTICFLNALILYL